MSSYSFYERIEGHIYIKSFLSRTDYPDSINQSVIRIQIHILVFRTELYRQGVTTFCQSNRDRITQSPIIPVALTPVRHHHRTRFLSVYQQSTDSRLVFCVYRSVANAMPDNTFRRQEYPKGQRPVQCDGPTQ